MGSFCVPADICIDNKDHSRFTKLTMEVPDFPGLLRVVSWVLNGLELRVENAEIGTTDDGNALNTFYVTDYNGNKLNDFEADMVQTRLSDLINYCSPASANIDDAECKYSLSSGDYLIQNECDGSPTEIIVQGAETSDNGALLEIASVMTGMGVQITSAVIQSCVDCQVQINDPNFKIDKEGRLFHFKVKDFKGHNLDSLRANSLLYTLNLLRAQGF